MLEGKQILKEQNYSFIVLILKRDSLEVIGDYRPIVLLNSYFKIISKLLANRLAIVLPHLVDETQLGFIQERSILNGIVLTKEVIHHCKMTKKKGFLLKLDFGKAYDMVSLECLLEVIKKSGFGDRWT